MRVNIPVVSLFCGCGGMDYGLREQGFSPVVALDNNESAVETYNANNNPPVGVVFDISKLSGRKIVAMLEAKHKSVKPRGVVGGPPCQPFSISNVHQNPADPRNALPLKYASILKALNKKYSLDFFLFENVVGLKSEKFSDVFQSLKRGLEDAGFNIFVKVLNARDFGVAQSRKRLFIIGINRDLYPGVEFAFPTGDGGQALTVRDVINSLPEPTYFKRTLSADDIPFHQNHWTMNPKSDKFRINLNGNGSTTGRSFRKLDWDKPSSTVAFGHREINVHPNGHRRLSIFEAMRIQGLPSTYRIMGNLTEQVTQVSDTVPPPVASAIGKSIKVMICIPQMRLSRDLIKWYHKNHRDFPWRKTNDPYRVLIAEKLLQQTSATEGLVKAYNLLISKYPDLKSLSQAEAKDVASIVGKLGLGYRAHELVQLGKFIVERHDGRIPRDLNKLLKLPGVGQYTARAVCCFTYGYDVAMVDTNIARFIYRVFGWPGRIPTNPARVQKLIRQADKLIIPGKARFINLAMLDLCNSICKTRDPRCSDCPVSAGCKYRLTHSGA